jgi:hypothetical protein
MPLRGGLKGEFSRHGEIYRSDVEAKGRERQLRPLPALIGVDESPAGYSSAGCSPAVPASASPTGFRMR